MKKYLLFVSFFLLLALISCTSGVDDPGVDCTQSDLSISVVSSVKSDCDKLGKITVEAEGGEGDYLYSIDGENFQNSPVFENLFAGEYRLSVKDNVGCLATVNFMLESEPTGITLNLIGSESECSDDTGTIRIEASGGVGTLEFSLDQGSFSTNVEYTGISAGNHSVVAMDEADCKVTKIIKIRTDVSLDNDIMPIITKDCAISGCHDGSQSPRLSTNSEVMQNAIRIKSETQAGTMPRDGTLTQTEIDLITCWVDDGALDN